MSRRLPVAAVLVAGVSLLAHPSMAAGATGLHVKDLAGDANGLNSQDVGAPLPATSTAPASIDAADITGIDFHNLFKTTSGKRVPNGLTVTLTLAAAPQAGINYLLTADVSSTCDGTNSTMQFGYEDMGAISNELATCQAPPGGTAADIGSTEVDPAKHTITWTVYGGFAVGARVTNIYASSSVFVLGVVDEATSEDAFVYGK